MGFVDGEQATADTVPDQAPAPAHLDPTSLAQWRLQIEAVIAAGGPTMHLQPIADFAAGRVAGYEALARFGTGAGAPDRWFRRAHQVGLGAELEAAAVRSALGRRADLAPHQFLTVNVSPAALASPPLLDAFRSVGPLNGVVLELTEHDPMSDRARLGTALEQMRELGALIAIDDIGTGYAGLEWVLSLRPEMVKLDREFIRGVDTDEARATFIRFIGGLVDKLDTWLIVEGIETDGELDVVVGLDVPLGQGYRLGYPQHDPAELADDVVDRIARTRQVGSRSAADVGAYMEHPPTVNDPQLHRTDARHVVLVDDFAQPVALLGHQGRLPVRPTHMRVKPGDDLRTVVQRALTRAPAERWDPLFVTDAAGRYQGIIRMERLVRALAEEKVDLS